MQFFVQIAGRLCKYSKKVVVDSTVLMNLLRAHDYHEGQKYKGRSLGQLWDQILLEYNSMMTSDGQKTKKQLQMHYKDLKRRKGIII